MKIEIPEGLEVETKPGSSVELLAKFNVTEDGKLELTTLDGVAVEMEDKETETEETETEATDAELEAALAGIGAGGEEKELPTEEEFFASVGKQA